MAQMTSADVARRYPGWQWWARMGLGAVLAIAIAYMVGAYITGPAGVRGEDGYVPPKVSQLKAASVTFANPDGTRAILPVRLADTADARATGLAGVGDKALDSTFLLYSHAQLRTFASRYPMNGVRTALEVAVIGADGEVIATRQALPNTTVIVSEPHQWVLAVKEGLFEHYGIVVGSTLDPNSIRIRGS